MITIEMLPKLLKRGRLVLHMEPYFTVEYTIDACSMFTSNRIEIIEDRKALKMVSNDNARVRIHFCESDETIEYAVVAPLGDKEFKTYYDLFAEALYTFIRVSRNKFQDGLKGIDVVSDPYTAGIFHKITYDRIMHGMWASANVEFEYEEH